MLALGLEFTLVILDFDTITGRTHKGVIHINSIIELHWEGPSEGRPASAVSLEGPWKIQTTETNRIVSWIISTKSYIG